MAGYSQTPLLKKLGIKPEMNSVFLNLPRDVKKHFNSISYKTNIVDSEKYDYIHLFCLDREKLETEISSAINVLNKEGILWISWPKAGKLNTDLNGNIVREVGLKLGVVDIKVAAVDDTWSGLKFVFRLKDRK